MGLDCSNKSPVACIDEESIDRHVAPEKMADAVGVGKNSFHDH